MRYEVCCLYYFSYATNISMYLLLKASKTNMKNHPIVKRLFQYRQHLTQADAVFEESIKPQVPILMNLEVHFYYIICVTVILVTVYSIMSRGRKH